MVRGWLVAMMVWLAACSSEPAESVATANATTSVTRLRIRGDSNDVILSDPATGTNGFLNVGRDNVAGTSSLDFSYVTPTGDPDLVILEQGSGEIPNSAYTTTTTTAHLAIVTPYPVIRCEINLVTADFTCVDGAPVGFDLTWVRDGFAQVEEHVVRRETFGPVAVNVTGWYRQRSALVNGTFGDNTAVDNSGNFLDTKDNTLIREITVQRP